jgi:hypothetical protein
MSKKNVFTRKLKKSLGLTLVKAGALQMPVV